MGVRGLTTYIDEYNQSCVKVVDLIQIAKERKVELIVDFYSFIGFLLPEMYRNVRAYYGNEYLAIPGGDYCLYHHWIMRIAEDLRNAGIVLVFYADGPVGASLSHKESKMPTLKKRHEESVQKMLNYLDICNKTSSIDGVRMEDSLWPLLYDVQIVASLREAGFEYHRLAFGEADYVLMQAFKNRGAVAVLSNDSDFAIFRDCVWMPLKYFDMENSLKIRLLNPKNAPFQNIFESIHLEKLFVGVVTNESMMKSLQLSWPELINLSIIQGNDFTSPIIRKYLRLWRDNVRIPKSDPTKPYALIKDVATYVRKLDTSIIQESSEFYDFCQTVPEFVHAIEHSKKFYNLNLVHSDARYKPGTITKCIESVAPHLMGMHFGFYWHKVIVEDPHLIPIEILMVEVRRSIYRMLCNRAVKPSVLEVTELGRSMNGALDLATVYSGGPIFGMTFADEVVDSSPKRNFETIQRIMLRIECSGYKEDLISLYGWRHGFLCVCLRFFLTLNWRQFICVDEEEFLSLFSMAFGTSRQDLEFYYSLRILPSVRCITIFNWFQDIYRHAYLFLGPLFHVMHEMPSPKDCLSASMFYAFFMIRYPEDF